MMRKVSLVVLGAVLGAAAAGVASQPHLFDDAQAANSDTYRYLNLFGDVFERVRSDYVEKPDEKKLIEAAINGMLTSLDPHSTYMDPKKAEDRQVDISGEFGGLGIEIIMENNAVKVMGAYEEAPAARAGVLAGDFIVKVDGNSLDGKSLDEAKDMLRGAVNTPVTITIKREGKDDFDLRIVRETIKVPSVRSRIEGDDIGYIKINQFSAQTFDGLKNAIADIQKKVPADKLKGYVIDLRNNPGGLLVQAVQVSDAFLEKGEIVSTRGRNPENSERQFARPGDLTNGKPIVVLVNGGSASASEIVAGALQDHKRATLIGTRSFGKGSVQTQMTLGSQGTLALTTARYFTPSGRSIQATGVDPDIIIVQDIPDDIKGKDETQGEAGLKGHLRNDGAKEEKGGSSAYVPPDPKNDKQLIAAVALLHGEKVETNTTDAAPAASTDAPAKN